VLQQQKVTMNEPKMPEQFVAEQVASALNMPVISRLRFAEMIGVSEGVVQGWIAKGYIPTYTVGKYTLVNLALLNRMALDKAPWLTGAHHV
jgi:hypothetical protein